MAKTNTTIIQIPSPCQQPWQEMEPRAGGRFCAHCQHVVRDLTHLSDAELAKLMDSPDAPHCGRVRTAQLGREIGYVLPQTGRMWPRLAVAAMLAMAATPHLLLAQQSVRQVEAPVSNIPPLEPGGQKLFSLRGSVVGVESGTPLEGITVTVMGTSKGAFTDLQGKFMIELDLDSLGDSVVVVFDSYWNTENLVISLPKADLPQNLSVALLEEDSNLQISVGVMVATPRRGLRKKDK